MLFRILAPAKSGKTEYLLSKLAQTIKHGGNCILLVPEHQSMQTEKLLCERFGDSVNLKAEVLSFDRLTNRISREYGGLTDGTIDSGGRLALLSIATEKIKNELHEYASVAEDSGFIEKIALTVETLKTSGISAEALLEIAQKPALQNAKRLKTKLYDIAAIYAEYQRLASQNGSDPLDALDSLGEELASGKKPFFKGKSVFIDGYYSFTGQEYEILRSVIEQSREVYITFCCDDREFFAENNRCAELVKSLSENKCTDFVPLYKDKDEKKSLRHLEQYIWETETPVLHGDDGNVSIIKAENPFDEADLIAQKVRELVISGMRYRDICVISRKNDLLFDLLRESFEKNDIPIYISKKETIEKKPLFSFICACLEVAASNFSVQSIRKYIKSGYAPISDSEGDILLRYVESWSIRGKAWYDGREWAMDPEGYRQGDLTLYGAHILTVANAAREKLAPALDSLRLLLTSPDCSIKDACKGLYEHLIFVKADEKLLLSVNRKKASGDEEQARRESMLWDSIINMFDQITTLCGDEKLSPARLCNIFTIMSGQYGLGAVPAFCDAVTVGDARTVRPDNCRAAILSGCNDGVFPAWEQSPLLFDEEETKLLSANDCEFALPLERRLYSERFYFYNALATPKEKLIFTYSEASAGGGSCRPSVAITRVRRLLPDISDTSYEQKSIFSPYSAARAFYTLADDENKEQLQKELCEKGWLLENEQLELCMPESNIDYGKTELSMSASRLERYNYCAFSFFGQYLMQLRNKEKNKFSSLQIGEFVHKVLEIFLSSRVKNGKYERASSEEIKESAESICDDCFTKTLRGAESDERQKYLLKRIKRLLQLLLQNLNDEFSQSDFVPSGFEVSFGTGNSDFEAPVFETENGRVILRGCIDRIDTYEKDGIKYIRVVDYKTFDKKFDLRLIDNGIDMQLPLYMFAYCSAQKNTVPAGLLYYKAILPNVQAEDGESEQEIMQKVYKELRSSGILLADESILLAMENSQNGTFIPVTYKKDGSYTKYSRVCSKEEFVILRDKLVSNVKALAKRIINGDMSISPLHIDETHDACTFCKLKSACRFLR